MNSKEYLRLNKVKPPTHAQDAIPLNAIGRQAGRGGAYVGQAVGNGIVNGANAIGRGVMTGVNAVGRGLGALGRGAWNLGGKALNYAGEKIGEGADLMGRGVNRAMLGVPQALKNSFSSPEAQAAENMVGTPGQAEAENLFDDRTRDEFAKSFMDATNKAGENIGNVWQGAKNVGHQAGQLLDKINPFTPERSAVETTMSDLQNKADNVLHNAGNLWDRGMVAAKSGLIDANRYGKNFISGLTGNTNLENQGITGIEHGAAVRNGVNNAIEGMGNAWNSFKTGLTGTEAVIKPGEARMYDPSMAYAAGRGIQNGWNAVKTGVGNLGTSAMNMWNAASPLQKGLVGGLGALGLGAGLYGAYKAYQNRNSAGGARPVQKIKPVTRTAGRTAMSRTGGGGAANGTRWITTRTGKRIPVR